MVNGPMMCDFDCGHPQGGRGGKSLVEYTQEDLDYYETLIRGYTQEVDGVAVFFGPQKERFSIDKVGAMEIAFQNELFGPSTNRGVVGRVAREAGHNAFEMNMYGSKINGGAASATPFRTYKISPLKTED